MSRVKVSWNEGNDPQNRLWEVNLLPTTVANYLFSTVAAGAGDWYLIVRQPELERAYSGQAKEVFNQWMADNPSDQYLDDSYHIIDMEDHRLIQFKKH